jgi:hypothetical protein
VPDHLDDLLVVGRGDHGVEELAQDALLYRMGVLDVIEHLLPSLVFFLWCSSEKKAPAILPGPSD